MLVHREDGRIMSGKTTEMMESHGCLCRSGLGCLPSLGPGCIRVITTACLVAQLIGNVNGCSQSPGRETGPPPDQNPDTRTKPVPAEQTWEKPFPSAQDGSQELLRPH